MTDPAPNAPLTPFQQGPVRLCCGQRHGGVQCPDGLVMCCLCFERVPVDQLARDPDSGQPEDVCGPCAEKEAVNA